MSRTIESQMSLTDARERILAQAEPGEAIETSLGEAVGLVLAESVEADVDQPPFDRANHDGYAVRASEAAVGTFLRVITPRWSSRAGDLMIEAGEAARVLAGEPIPPGADAIVRPSSVRPDPDTGPTRVIEILRPAHRDSDVCHRGSFLNAGATIAAAGTRIKPALIPLLAAQGCVHPICHRRVRVSILSVGNQWVKPDEAPTMNRERNANNIALATLIVRAEAMAHDFQAGSGPALPPLLERAATSPVVVLLGSSFRAVSRRLHAMGFEPLVTGIAVNTISRARYGVIRDEDGRVVNHLFHLPNDPIAASVGFALLVEPLIARLQGEQPNLAPSLQVLAAGTTQPATRRRARLKPAILRAEGPGRMVAAPIAGGLGDLAAHARADGWMVLPEQSGPWQGGDQVEFVPLGPSR